MSVKLDLDANKERIDSFCNRHKYIAFEKDGTFCVISNTNKWIIADGDSEDLVIYHKNSVMNRHSLKSFQAPFAGYHLQNCKRNTIIGYLYYIRSHDRYIRNKDTQLTNKKKLKKIKERNKKIEISRVLSIIEDLDKIDKRSDKEET